MEESNEKPGYASLRRFRESTAGSTYFITTNLARRGSGLELPGISVCVFDEWRKLETEGLWRVRSAMAMPDHVHLLVQLGEEAPLAECMRVFKGRLTPVLRRQGLKWQEGFYEHRMRESEDLLPVFLYIYLNPYRARLIGEDQAWPGYYCHADDWHWFGPLTRESVPQPEWLR